MTRKAFLKKYFWRFASSLVLAGLIVYILYHVFGGAGKPLTTPTKWITEHSLLGAEAYLFRDEKVLTGSSVGVVNELAASGEKVGKGDELAELWSAYSEEEREDTQRRVDEINRMLRVLEESRVPLGTNLSFAERFYQAAMRHYVSLRESSATGNWQDLWKHEDGMLAMLNRYATLIESGADVEDAIVQLTEERTALLHGSHETLSNTGESGYFYGRASVDGYEGLFTLDALRNLTVEAFSELTAAEASTESRGAAIGKMVYGYDWSLAMRIDEDSETLFSVGERYTLTFPENRDRELTMTCSAILTEGDGAILVLTTYDIPAEFSFYRHQRVEITVGTVDGYHIPESALYTVNGVEGVYIFQDSTARFRRIEVLYRGDGYCIAAEQGDRGNDYLALHDILIVSGGNLYDGRVYR